MAATTLLGQFTFLAIHLFQTDEAADFQNLGGLLLIGFIVAAGAGIAFTVIRLKLREKKPRSAEFISISEFKSKQ